MDGASPFKVVVIGGGPVGLTAAHALSRAGIDFVVLEKRPTAIIETGSDLVMLPMAIRVLHQLGLYDELKRVSAPLAELQRIDHHGRNIGSSRFILQVGLNHGYSPATLSRHSLTSLLYNNLSSDLQARIHPNKQVVGIATTDDGVVVSCADGTSYSGSMIIGADGAHSMTRQRMRELALEDGYAEFNGEKPFLTTFRAIWMRIPAGAAGLEPGYCSETHGPIATTQLFTGEKSAVIGLYERLDKPTRERIRYTAADEEAIIKRWGHLPITSRLSVADAWAGRQEGGLVSLEEGVLDHWHYGRIVLTGDAAHKFTPSTGQGCNVGIIDIVVLVNELRRTLDNVRATNGPEALPSQEALSSAFEKYQSIRYDLVVMGCKRAGSATANATWGTTFMWFFDRFVISWHFLQKLFANRVAPIIARSPKFEFIEWDEPVRGRVPWTDPTRNAPLTMK